MTWADHAITIVNKCADEIEKGGHHIGGLRSVDATEASRWLLDMASEMRKACEEDIGIPGWYRWLDDLLQKHGLEHSSENTTEADLEMRRLVEVAFVNQEDERDAVAEMFAWRQWTLDLMLEHKVCDESALLEEFDSDVAQETLATCFKDYEVRIEQLQARVKELEDSAGAAFTSDKE